MPSLGPAEILVVLVIALLVFGPNKMPEIARQVGRGMREFRRVQQHLGTELRDVVSEFDGSAEATTADAAPAPSDPVPTLPPKVETLPPDAIEPLPPAPVVPPVADEHPAPGGSEAIPRGQRVWSP